MKLFLIFLISVFVFSLFSRMKRRKKLWIAFAICLFVSFGYFFLDQI